MQTIPQRIEPDFAGEAGLRSLLTAAIDEEVGLLDTLRKVFVSQRKALVAGDPTALDDGVFAATRILRTLDEARRRRRKITAGLVGEEIDFEELDTVITGASSRPVRLAQERLRTAAGQLREEVTLVRRILQVALTDNRRYLDALLGEGSASESPGALLDRKA